MNDEQRDAIRWARDVAIAGKWEHVKALGELLSASIADTAGAKQLHKQFAWDLHDKSPLNEKAFAIARARFGTNTELQDRMLYQAILVYLAAPPAPSVADQGVECNCESNPHAENCPVTAHVRALFAASGESARGAPSVADAPAKFTERERFVWNLGYSAGKEETVCLSFEEFFDAAWKRGDCIEDAKPAMRRAWDAATDRAANVAQKCMHGKTYEEHGRTNWNNGIAEAVDAIRALAPEAGSNSVADAAGASDKPLTDAQIEAGWRQTFSTDNPYCPCNLKSFTKAVRWAERVKESK